MHLMHYASRLIVLLAATIVLGVSCGDRQPATVVSGAKLATENEERAKLQLRQIHPDWYLYRREFGADDWKIASSDGLVKRVQRDTTGKLLWEEDYYYTGRTFSTSEGQQWETLTVHYDYGPRKLLVSYVGQDATTSSLVGRANSLATTTEKLSVVEEILRRWGIPRL